MIPVSSMRGKYPAPFHWFPWSYRGLAEREGRREPVPVLPKAGGSGTSVWKWSAVTGSNGNCSRKNMGLWCQDFSCKILFGSYTVLKCGATAIVKISVVVKDYLVPLVCYCWVLCFLCFFNFLLLGFGFLFFILFWFGCFLFFFCFGLFCFVFCFCFLMGKNIP